MIRPTADGDQEEEAYSSMGRTYVLKARVMIDGLLERKQRRINDDRWFARQTMSFMWRLNFKSGSTMTPRSLT